MDRRIDDSPIEHLLRDTAPRVLAILLRRGYGFADAEDAVQDAMLAAHAQWTRDDLPRNPGGWLFQVARRRLVDRVESDRARQRRELSAARIDVAIESATSVEEELLAPDGDDTLLLLFTCCHPSLSTTSAIALTLRALAGLTTAEIAAAFFVPEATMAQRIHRAKQSIEDSSIPIAVPARGERTERLPAVLHVLYLAFNEGYAASSGQALVRIDLSSEAIRLARRLHRILPDESEVAALLALMLLTDARRFARVDASGDLVPLDQQDRSLWNVAAIAEGTRLVSESFRRGAVGRFALEAAIAALHDEAPSFEQTDWPQILALYSVLLRMSDNPMIALNHAIALAMVNGEAAGLRRLDELASEPSLSESHRLDATRAHLLERSGKRDAARACFERAAHLANNSVERRYLLRKAERLHSD